VFFLCGLCVSIFVCGVRDVTSLCVIFAWFFKRVWCVGFVHWVLCVYVFCFCMGCFCCVWCVWEYLCSVYVVCAVCVCVCVCV